MPELLEIDGVNLRGQGFGAATRTGRYNLPSRRGENLVLAGSSGSRFLKNKPFEEGFGALACWAIGAQSEVVTNLATNPGLEGADLSLWFTQWFGQNGGAGTSGRVAGAGMGGSYGYRKTWTAAPAGTSEDTGAGVIVNVTPGKTYSWAFQVRSSRAQRITTAHVWKDASGTGIGGTNIDASAAVVTPAGAFNRLGRAALVAPAGAATLSVFSYPIPGTGHAAWQVGDTLDMDEMLIVEGSLPPVYFDGSTTSTDPNIVYAWKGTPHASASTRTNYGVLQIPDSFSAQRAAFESNMNKLLRLFTRGHRLSTIRAAQPDGSIRRALVEWSEWSEPEVMAGGTRAEFAMGFKIPGVWWEDENLNTQGTASGATLPKTLDLTSFTGMTGIIEDALFQVVGPITNPRITDAETGAWVQYTGTVPTGQDWVVNCANFTSVVGGASVMSKTSHAGNYKLLVIPNCFGTDDTPRLTLSGSAAGASTYLLVQARRKWANG